MPRLPALARIPGLLAALALAPAVAPAQQPPDLHVVIVADTDDDRIGPDCAADLGTVRGLFQDNVPKGRTQVVKVFAGKRGAPGDKDPGPNNFNQAAIAEYLKTAPLGANTGVLVYYCGHGDYTAKDGHRMLIPGENNGRLANEDVFRLVAARGTTVRMIAVITDSCCPNVGGDTARKKVPAKKEFGFSAPADAPEPFNRVPEVMDDLFYKPAPTKENPAAILLDVNSCSEDEAAWGREGEGGFFTTSLAGVILDNGLIRPGYRDDQPGRDGQKDGRLTWHEILPPVIKQTKSKFEFASKQRSLDGPNGKPQKAQIPQPFRLPDPGPNYKYRYSVGLDGKGSPGGGMQVVKVAPGGPAEKAGLKPGDVVRKLNGKSVRNFNDFACMVDFAEHAWPTPADAQRFAGRPELRVVVDRDGKEAELGLLLREN